MVSLHRSSIKNNTAWTQAGIENINFDYDRMLVLTRENPAWVHFGAGNIFRGFIAVLQQTLLNTGQAQTGIVAVEAYDAEIIKKIYTPYDNLGLLAIMNADGSLEKKLVASISEGLVGDPAAADDWQRLTTIFTKPSLQIVSFTITEKGYNLKAGGDTYAADVLADMANGPEQPRSAMAKVTALAYIRYRSGALPVAFVSMDNCSHNGDKLHNAMAAIAGEWVENGLAETGFLTYLNNPQIVSFPWSMIDKITPRPAAGVQKTLQEAGFSSTDIICTGKNTFIAPFVNAEKPEYLVIEDKFPNGRPPLEQAGVFFTDRQTVDLVEKMKVGTCLNPLHTALAIFGCLLGYTLIADEMKDPQLKKLVEKIGYQEGLPVVMKPGIMDPGAFIREVIEVRLPNPYIPDTPQRIATDTSQKVGVRFGETIKAYTLKPDLDPRRLVYIPLVIAGWCRYLLGVDDQGRPMSLSPDPLLASLAAAVAGIRLGEAEGAGQALHPLLGREDLFGINLYEIGLGEKIEHYFAEMTAGTGAVRSVLQKYLPTD
ncbi:mannitol dehydrogenase family protein [Sporomusa termitida]|uniref:Mannitol 2-dehydrogenase n=1 Tax=Sporomusa termitida TaxID=2377 RepID=A0A517E0L1_9FIRM|nr:mannitol dehydrogenase family protein [Sporomusa termitida]QDR83141.1 Mannitol 2-dehydrogenase [Sporomusa termitida]